MSGIFEVHNFNEFEAKYLAKEINIFEILDTNFSTILYGDTTMKVSLYSPFISALHTLSNIDYLLVHNNFSNAYVLIRKLRDDVIQYLFLLRFAVNKNLQNFVCSSSHREDLKVNYQKKTVYLNELNSMINHWLENRLEDNYLTRKVFSYESYIKWLRLEPSIDTLFNLYFAESSQKISKLLNSYIHANGVNYIYDNYRNISNYNKKEQKVNELKDVVVFIVCLTLSLVCLIRSSLLRTSDYLDAVESGMQPLKDCQYWVIDSVKTYMKRNFTKIHKDLYKFVVENNVDCMNFNDDYSF